jgi:hypothetical protein
VGLPLSCLAISISIAPKKYEIKTRSSSTVAPGRRKSKASNPTIARKNIAWFPRDFNKVPLLQAPDRLRHTPKTPLNTNVGITGVISKYREKGIKLIDKDLERLYRNSAPY